MAQEIERKSRPGIWKETIFIVVSVALGYVTSQYASYREERQVAEQALSGIRNEIANNIAALEPLLPIHERWSDELDRVQPGTGKSGLDVFFATRPPLPPGIRSPFAFLQRSAWDAAIAGGALRHFDFDLVSALSELYKAQEVTTENVRRLAEGALVQVDLYDPAKAGPSVRLLWLTLADITSAEARLLGLYKEHLTKLDTAID